MRHRRLSWLIELPLALLAVLTALPIVLIFVTAFKPDAEIVRFSGFLPETPTFANFRHFLDNPEEAPLLRWLVNSIIVAGSATLLVLLVDSLAAFLLARLRPPGHRALFVFIVAMLMVPAQVIFVPLYLLLSQLHLLDTYWALILPPAASPFGVFLLHQFMKSIPRDIEEAARIDGCTDWQLYRTIILPLCRPALATLGIFVFIGSWNDFLGPLIYLDSLERYTLPVGIAMFQSAYANEYGLTLAASVVCTLPTLLAFLLFSRQIIRGLSAGAVKG